MARTIQAVIVDEVTVTDLAPEAVSLVLEEGRIRLVVSYRILTADGQVHEKKRIGMELPDEMKGLTEQFRSIMNGFAAAESLSIVWPETLEGQSEMDLRVGE